MISSHFVKIGTANYNFGNFSEIVGEMMLK